jgi:Holliday junction resolvase
MATQGESRLQRRIQEALTRTFPGCYVIKVHVSEFSAAGTPDLIACIHGYFIALEVKVPGETPTELQDYTLKCIRAAGGAATVVSSPIEAVAFVQEYLRGQP